MRVLGLDTALGACSAAVTHDGEVLAAIREPMLRGHQERLAPLVQEVMAQAGLPFAALDRIAVTVGPGSFTGLRVGLAFAKGLGLALGKPCVGIGSLEALAASEPGPGLCAAVIDAKRDQVYLQLFDGGAALMAPDSLPVEIAAARLAELWRGGPVRLVGPGAAALAGVAPEIQVIERAAPHPRAICALAAVREPTPARPLYLRAPDAKLPGGIDPGPEVLGPDILDA
jgi:tRNA threonylcarbamoyladenosine biosynthesis protein TsaB